MNRDLEKSFEFILEVEKLKAVERRTKPIGLTRYENSAEHSWQISLLALVLVSHSNEKIDTERVMKMLLIHDIGEIDADDVFFFDDSGREDVKEKELKAIRRIFGFLPEEKNVEFIELWKEFEYGDSEEAKFARAVDRVMPILLNLNNNMQSWLENGVSKEEILAKTAYIAEGSQALWDSVSAKIEEAFAQADRG